MERGRRGSALVVVLIIVIILLVIGGWFWYYEAHNPLPPDQINGFPTNKYFTNTSSPEFSISEWGVQFQEPAGIGNLVYSISPVGILYFSTQQLEAMASSCAPSFGGIGALVRSTSTDIFDGPITAESSGTIGGYYYALTAPNGMCSTNQQALTLQEQQTKLLEGTILQTLELSNP